MDVASVAAGALVGAVASDAYDVAKDKAKEVSPASTVEHGPVEMGMLVEVVSRIEKLIDEARQINCKPDGRRVPLYDDAHGEAYRYRRRGFKHVSLLTKTAVNIDVRTPIGTITFAMNVGWNPFDMPDDSMLQLNGTTQLDVWLYWADDSIEMAGV